MDKEKRRDREKLDSLVLLYSLTYTLTDEEKERLLEKELTKYQQKHGEDYRLPKFQGKVYE